MRRARGGGNAPPLPDGPVVCACVHFRAAAPSAWMYYMAVILCKKYSTFRARLFMCAHTYLCPRAHESGRTSCAHAENKSYTRPLNFHAHFSAYMRTPVLVFSQQYGLAKTMRKKKLMFWFCLSHPYKRHETASKIALRHAGRALSLLQPAFRSST